MSAVEQRLLTDAELRALDLTVDLVSQFRKILAPGPTRTDDLTEFVQHVHAIQHSIMAQAAARAYPNRFRLLGGTVS